eukprot:TRINITY_DN61721_c0_g1_i1.p1 TRINITY_DN61721_c0_g1~~TRINITY_DN61721_c0_g1_i1.p1  ORF type:complete len:561 (+),score=93.22 TRINITY_DN61721_c0_g1_i1:105-1787(+)
MACAIGSPEGLRSSHGRSRASALRSCSLAAASSIIVSSGSVRRAGVAFAAPACEQVLGRELASFWSSRGKVASHSCRSWWWQGPRCPCVQRRAASVAIAREVWRTFISSPLSYMTIPVVAAIVGYGTNWVGVKMIFYPINFWGVDIKRWPQQPLGFIGWQGIVPCKVAKMSRRLVDIITTKLLSLKEAFSRLDPVELADLLEPSVARAIEHDAKWGEVWITLIRPSLRPVLIDLVKEMQRDIESLLDLQEVVSSAFLKDKVLLGELFQKAGRKELEFLVNSGFFFGFFLGIFQMLLWICFPNNWVLPAGGALVGYITNWVAIKLIFDPVEPTPVGPFVFQGLFEKRQVEVSMEFSEFLAERVLTSQRLIDEIANGRRKEAFQAMVRRIVPPIVPDHVARSAAGALGRVALEPSTAPIHVYVDGKLGLQKTLNERLCKLSSPEFENLLHPVFEEDEIILIVAGGVLGAAAGFFQMAFGWGGPSTQGAAAIALNAGASAGAGAAAAKAALLLPPQVRRLLSWSWLGLRRASQGCLRRRSNARRGSLPEQRKKLLRHREQSSR